TSKPPRSSSPRAITQSRITSSTAAGASASTPWATDAPPARGRAPAPRSDVDRAHAQLVVAIAGGRRDLLRDPLDLLIAQLDVGGGQVLFEVGDVPGPRDRDDVLPAVQHPGERQLSRRDGLVGCELLDALGELQVLLEVLAREARVVAAEVALVELVGRGQAPCEEAAAERRVGDEADAELLERRQDLVLDVACPQRVLALHGGYPMHGVRPADRLGSRLGTPGDAELHPVPGA